MTNPMTTTGDTIYSSSGSTPARLGIGTTGQVLTVAGGVPSWATPAGGGGKVLQVLSATRTGEVGTSSTTYAQITSLSIAITPSSASSQILVLANINGVQKNAGNSSNAVGLRVLRGATNIMDLSDNNGFTNASETNMIGSVVGNVLDSPATTSSTTYSVHFNSYVSGQTGYVNGYRAVDACVSSIIVLEIGA
jgi:hypothetical protein